MRLRWIGALALSCVAVRASAQGTAFTYQGFLQRSGVAVSDSCDFAFALYDRATGASPLETEFLDNVAIDAGVFTVELDFGTAAFDGDDRWLESAVVCPAGSGALTVLEPRQKITPAPLALHALRAGMAPWSGLTGLPSGFADGTDDDTRYFAGAGLTLLGNVFEVNSAVIQQRVGQTCAVGSSIRAVNNDGSVLCEADDDTTYTAGLGLTLSGNTFSVATDTIQRRVGASCAPGFSIRSIAVDGSVSCEADDDSGGDITAVTAGDGLDGGGGSGAVSLSVRFGGSGGSSTAARSDHGHFGDVWTGLGPPAGLRVSNSESSAALAALPPTTPAAALNGVPLFTAIGVDAASSSGIGMGVRGLATASSGPTVGVRGEAWSTSGIGIEGESTSTAGASRGVHGVAASSVGVGVLGEATAETLAAGGLPIGVRGESAAGIGVVGLSFAEGGIGVAGSGAVGVAGDTGSSTGRGVSGRATAAVGSSVGVSGESNAASGFGGSFVNVNAAGPGLLARSGAGAVADIILGSNGSAGTADDGVIASDPSRASSDIFLVSNDGVVIDLNEDGSAEASDFEIVDKDDNRIFRVSDAGEVYADGTFHPGGADVAELLPGGAGLQPGDVLVIDPAGRLQRSSEPLQRNVAGVHSRRPGVLGGSGTRNDLPDSVPLAVLGVVTVKASAENGAIAPGDLLTTAATPGHAMRCPDPPACAGALIGKALASLRDETGEIEMLVSLH